MSKISKKQRSHPYKRGVKKRAAAEFLEPKRAELRSAPLYPEVFSDDVKIKIPSGLIIGGATCSGKTSLLMRLLENVNALFHPTPKSILYCYGQYGAHVKQLQGKGIPCMEGVPDDGVLAKFDKPMLLIFDDLMTSVSAKYLSDVFCKKAHHQNLCVIFLTQDLFDKNICVPRNNAQYLLLTRSLNSMKKIHTIGCHLFPGKVDYFLKCFKDATSKPYGYLLVDTHAATYPMLMLRTNIFPQDELNYVYSPSLNV